MKQNYEAAYFRCINWIVKSYEDHMKLLEYAIGFLHSKLKTIEVKYEELKKVHYKQKQIKARQKRKMLLLYEVYDIPEQLLPKDPEELREFAGWEKQLNDKQALFEELDEVEEDYNQANQLRSTNDLLIEWDAIKHLYLFVQKK